VTIAMILGRFSTGHLTRKLDSSRPSPQSTGMIHKSPVRGIRLRASAKPDHVPGSYVGPTAGSQTAFCPLFVRAGRNDVSTWVART